MAESTARPPAIAIDELPAIDNQPWSLSKLRRMLMQFGPAAIVASVAIGAGETIVVVRAGAWTGYGLLWLVLLSVIVKGVFGTYLIGRYTAVCGEPIGQRLVKLPGPRGWLLVLLVVLELAAAGPLWGAIARPCGELLGFLLFGSDVSPTVVRTLSTLFVALALGLSLLLTYDRLERQQLIICGILVLGTMIGTALVRPNLAEVFGGLLAFGNFPEFLPATPPQHKSNPLPLLAVTFGYVGGSVMTYLVYPDWIALHGWGITGHAKIEDFRRRGAVGKPSDYLPDDAQSATNVRRALGPLRWDVTMGAAVLLVVTVSFMLAGAAVLYPRIAAGEIAGAFEGWSLLTDQADIWANIHPMLVWVYYVCVVAALWGTLQAYPDIYARTTAEYARAIWPTKRWHQPRMQRWICVYVFVVATIVLWSDLDFHLLTLITAFLATNLGVAIAMIASLYLNFQLPPRYRTRWWVLAGGVFSAIAMLVVSLIAGYGVWTKVAALASGS